MDLWCKILLLTVHLFSLCINLLATILILKYIKHKQAGHQTLMDRVKTHYLITLSTHGAIFCLLPIGLISHEYMDYVVIQSISLLLSYSLLLLLFNILLFVVVRWVPNFPVKSKCFYSKKKKNLKNKYFLLWWVMTRQGPQRRALPCRAINHSNNFFGQ